MSIPNLLPAIYSITLYPGEPEVGCLSSKCLHEVDIHFSEGRKLTYFFESHRFIFSLMESNHPCIKGKVKLNQENVHSFEPCLERQKAKKPRLNDIEKKLNQILLNSQLYKMGCLREQIEEMKLDSLALKEKSRLDNEFA